MSVQTLRDMTSSNASGDECRPYFSSTTASFSLFDAIRVRLALPPRQQVPLGAQAGYLTDKMHSVHLEVLSNIPASTVDHCSTEDPEQTAECSGSNTEGRSLHETRALASNTVGFSSRTLPVFTTYIVCDKLQGWAEQNKRLRRNTLGDFKRALNESVRKITRGR